MYFIHVTGQGSQRWNAVADGDDKLICESNWPVNDDGVFVVLHGAESESLEQRAVLCSILLHFVPWTVHPELCSSSFTPLLYTALAR